MKTNVKIGVIDIDSIYPYSANSKKHTKKQVRQIADSIKTFGFNQPIVTDKEGVIIVGHGRYEGAKLLGMSEVPVIKVDLTEEEAKAYRLADNKLNESPWVMDLAMDDLKSLSEDMFKITGFDLDLLMTPTEDNDVLPQMVPARAAVGDIYALGDHRVMCGDSCDLGAVARLMNGKKSNMVFTDPPWNVAIGLDSNPRHRQRSGLINDNLGNNFMPFLEKLSLSIVENNTGDVYCVMGCEQWPNVHKALTNAGLHWSSTIVWAKDAFVLGRSKYHRQYEPIWYGWKNKSSYRGGRNQSDLWLFDRPKVSEEHPTMKPVDLVTKALLNSSNREDIVLDLFLGSGSTLIACEKAERICYGMELDPKYVDVIIARWDEVTGKKVKKL